MSPIKGLEAQYKNRCYYIDALADKNSIFSKNGFMIRMLGG